MSKEISIERQFENYATRVNLDKTKVSPVQYDETKKAFFAGASAMLLLFSTVIPDIPNDATAVMAIEKLNQEAEFYWKINLM
jgi:hypothetical protein